MGMSTTDLHLPLIDARELSTFPCAQHVALDTRDIDQLTIDVVASMTFDEARAAYPAARDEYENRVTGLITRPTVSLYNQPTAFGALNYREVQALIHMGWREHGAYAKTLLAIRSGIYDDAIRAGQSPYSTGHAVRNAGALRITALRAAELRANQQ